MRAIHSATSTLFKLALATAVDQIENISVPHGQYWLVGMSSQSVMPDGIAEASGAQCTMPPMSMLFLPDASRHCQSSHCTYLNGMPCFVHCAFTASSACSWFAKPEWLLLESKNACPHDHL